jgi:hypothetical protein
METLQSPNIQLFILNNTTLLSLVEIPGMDEPHYNYNGDLNASSDSALLIGGGVPTNQVRIILRDISGKFVWDTSVISTPPAFLPPDHTGCGDERHSFYRNSAAPPNVPPPPFPLAPSPAATIGSGGSSSLFSPPRHTKRHRPPSELPTHEAAAADLDQLDDLLQYLGHTAPELLSAPGRPLNSVAAWQMAPEVPPNQLEGDLISSVIGQRNLEQEQLVRYGGGTTAGYMRAGRPAAPPELTAVPEPEPFQQARILFQQLGLSSWEKRPHIQLVKKTEQLGQFAASHFTNSGTGVREKKSYSARYD